jgi:DNA-binding NarL/FixJ family response regulator
MQMVESVEQFLSDEKHLLFLSFSAAKREQLNLEKLTDLNRNCSTIIYDAPEVISTSSLVKLGRLRGYIPCSASNEVIEKGIDDLLDNNICIPRSIAYQLINYYQSVILRFREPYSIDLTQREIQVLAYLRVGLTNNKLADELFVSEHTIKSHLYKIFKKLSVSNRNQAIAWAHKYLP